jgi:hypothetical protein
LTEKIARAKGVNGDKFSRVLTLERSLQLSAIQNCPLLNERVWNCVCFGIPQSAHLTSSENDFNMLPCESSPGFRDKNSERNRFFVGGWVTINISLRWSEIESKWLNLQPESADDK